MRAEGNFANKNKRTMMVKSQVGGDGESVTYATVAMLSSTETLIKTLRLYLTYNISQSGVTYNPKLRPMTSNIGLPISVSLSF